MAERWIIHVDMDAFYAAVEVLDRPELAGRPIIVGGRADQRGVVSTASYEARRFGVHSAMAMATAVRLCPQAVFLPVRGERYAEVSRRIRAILGQYTPLVEPVSLDEAFLDVTGCERLFGPAEQIGRTIKQRIRGEVGLTASVGVAPNKFLAKLASDIDKPDGFCVVRPEHVQRFLEPLPVSRLWGVGRAMQERLRRMGIATVGELGRCDRERLAGELGRAGEQLWRLGRGIDESPVVPDGQAKSISNETTFASDIADGEQLRAVLLELCEQVGFRLRQAGLAGRTVTLKVRFDDFRTITRSVTLGQATDLTEDLWSAAARLLGRSVGGSRRAVRLLGLGCSNLQRKGQGQLPLFVDRRRERLSRLAAAADRVRRKYGRGSLQRGPGDGRGRAENGRQSGGGSC